MVNNPLDTNVGAGLSVKGILILGGVTLLTNFGSQYIQNKVAVVNQYKILNDSALSGTIKISGAVIVGSLVKNKYARYALAGVALDGAQDLLVAGYRKVQSMSGSQNEDSSSSVA